MIHLDNLTYLIAGRPILESASATVDSGHRVGLVGRNGAGKTTLLRLITGDLESDQGAVRLPARARLGITQQEAPGGPESLIETVLRADEELTTLRRAADQETDPDRIGQVHSRLAQIDGYAAEARGARILAGLGFDHAAQQRSCMEYSGGWRMRVALAALLFSQPDILLLDEPTNHLDLEATIWLEDYLRRYRGTVLIVSHDRNLLNRAVTEILHLDQGKLTLYTGTYDQFENARRERAARDAKARTRQIAERARIQKFVDRFRYQATKARQAQSRLKTLARMQPVADLPGEERTPIKFPAPDELAPPLFSCDDVNLGYGDNTVLESLNLRLDPNDRIALLGANGNGKSTFMRFLAGRLAPLAGTENRPRKLRVGYFAQHQVDELDMTATPFLELSRRKPKDTPQQLRNLLGGFGFSHDKSNTPVASLSGGEKARLLLSLMSCDRPHLLLLDEPTNHLDVIARELLVEALNDFPGAVIVVSHDPHLIETTADRLWLVENGGIQSFDGDIGDYRNQVLGQNDGRENGDGKSKSGKQARRKNRAAERKHIAPLRKKIRDSEKRVTALQAQHGLLETELAQPSLYRHQPERVIEINKQLAAIKDDIAAEERAWLNLQSELEAAEAPLAN